MDSGLSFNHDDNFSTLSYTNHEQNFEILETLQDQLIQREEVYDNVNKLNVYLHKSNREYILYVNIRSINANHTKLQVFIEGLKIKPSIIICSETWNIEHLNFFNLPEYKIYYNHSKLNQNDGVVIFFRNCITEITEIIEIGKLSILHSTINLDNNRTFEISSIYRCHDLPKCEFIESLKAFLTNKINSKNHIIVGDFNIDLLNLDVLNNEHLSNLLEKGYMPCFQTITRPSVNNPNEGSCIDNFYSKTKSFYTKAIKLENTFNDHYPLLLEIQKIDCKKVNKQSSNSINYIQLKKEATKIDWLSNLLIADPNEAIKKVIKLVDACITQAKTVKKKQGKKTPRSPWISKEIIVLCNKKEILYKKWQSNVENEEVKREYKKFVVDLDKIIRQAKYRYEHDEIERNSNNPRRLYEIINYKLGSHKIKNENIKYIIDDNKVKVSDPQIMANKMNQYFCNIGKKLGSKINKPPGRKLELPAMNHKTIFLKPTNRTEILSIINKFKNKKGGIDGINTKILKTLSDFLAEPLAHIINNCFVTGIWPDELKMAEVIPIHKSKEKYKPCNYRPISLISNLAKIMEKILHKRLLNFISQCDIISGKQYGFLKNRSTKDALSYIVDKVLNELDKSNPIAITFLDLAKAFDTVDHNILLEKLYRYGIRGKAQILISSYLKNRLQKVRVNGTYSEYEELNTGVPQGTILGPLLFIIYVNDLLVSLPEGEIISYADDTAVVTNEKSWGEIEEKATRQLHEVSDWLALNKLTLNIDKTVYITFGNYCNSVPDNIKISIKNDEIKRVESCKYLGMYIDYRLSWDLHVQKIVNKTKYLVFIFYKLSKIMQRKTLMIIYYSLFHSILSYGIIAWGGAYMNQRVLLQNLQNKILKIIDKNKSVNENIPCNIEQQFALESILYHYETLSKKYTESNSITRNKSLQIPIRYKTISIKRSLINAIHIFNRLPNQLKTINNHIKRKNKIKKWIIENIQ